MAFGEKELEIIQTAQSQGFSRQQTEEAIKNYRLGTPPERDSGLVHAGGRQSELKSLGSLAVGAGKGFLEGAIGTSRLLQAGGQGFLAGIDPTRKFSDVREQSGFKSLQGDKADAIDDILLSKNPEERAGKVIGFFAELAIGGGGTALRKGSALTVDGVKKLATKFGGKLPTQGSSGLVSKGSEILERVPRAISKVGEGLEESAKRAERLANATPATKTAIKSGLDDRFIASVEQADSPTLKAYREMLDIAEDTGGGTLRPKAQPSIVAGRTVEEQFDVIEKQRKVIGQQIGSVVDELSKTQRIDVLPEIREMRILLSKNGIGVFEDGLKFTGKFTPQERTAIEQAYKLATEGGESLTPRQIYDMDKLFSKLQRESRFEGLGDLFVDTADGGQKSLFSAFRDIYSKKLETLSPEIKDLNREYRLLRTVVDDAESSIFKTPNFEATKATDPAEFAKVNLRRIAGEAQSSPAYQAVLEEMDALARQLGYSGARADDLVFFAQELRKLYPEIIPPTGFSGGIRASVSNLAEKVFKAGEPTDIDKQRALRALIEEVFGAN